MSKQDRAVIIRDRDAFLKHVVAPRQDIKPNVKLMIAIMLTHVDNKTGECTVGARKLATEMGCTLRHAQELLKKVKATGLVDWPKNKGGGPSNTNRYIFIGLQYCGNSTSPTTNTVFGVHNGNYEQTAPSTTNKIEANYEQNDPQLRTLCSYVQVSQVSGLSQGSESEEDFKEEGGGNRETSGAERKKGAIRGTEVEVGTESANRGFPLESPLEFSELQAPSICPRMPEANFEEFRTGYPRGEDDWKPVERRYRAILKSGVTHATLMVGVKKLIRETSGRQQAHIVRADNWLSQGGWKVAEAEQAANQVATQRLQTKFYAKEDSPERQAWDDHGRRVQGKTYPRDRNGGWYFDSRWPPGHEAAA
jgi:hypothetical protein